MKNYAVIFQSFTDELSRTIPFFPIGDTKSVICIYADTTVKDTKISSYSDSDIEYVDIVMPKDFGGTLCSALMSIKYIDNNNPLLIVGHNLSPNFNANKILSEFEESPADCGIVFKHGVDKGNLFAKFYDDCVTMLTDDPYSGQAIEDFLYFKHGCDFVSAAKTNIMNGKRPDERFDIYRSVNELILLGKNVVAI